MKANKRFLVLSVVSIFCMLPNLPFKTYYKELDYENKQTFVINGGN
jgi:hypothetical protein